MSDRDALLDKANRLPLLPGVYLMHGAEGEIIYVGKAKKLKNRVSSYFHGDHLPKVEAMVRKVADFEVVVVNSEFEALMLENALIKRHMPHYNILLKDDKGYPFVRLDLREEYPRFSVVNRPKQDGARYFGPYGGRGTTFDILNTLQKALLLPTCSRRFPRDIGKERPCLNFQMGLCAGYCRREARAEDYRDSISQAVLVLSGKTEELKAELQAKMEQASEELRFENAAQYRDRLRAVENLANRQRVIATAFADTDAIGFFRGAKTCFAVLHYVEGNLAGKDFELMDEPLEEDAEAVCALTLQYYDRRGTFPQTVLLPVEIEDAEAAAQLLSERAGRKIRLLTPKRGEKTVLTETANLNAREEVQRITTLSQRRNKTLEWLQRTLELPALPRRIESFDISNTGNSGIVAGMVVFVDGKPLKRDYRRFKMKTVTAQDDYASMYEAVSRRFARAVEGDEKFAELPDLLLIDGGEVHAQTAERALADLGLELPVYGMVKDDRHRTRALITSGGREIGIVGNQAVFSFVGTIQEEVHRYSIEYHRKLRSAAIRSTLDDIPGVGEKRRAQLLKEFKTIRAIRAATVEQLRAAVPEHTARAVYAYFHEGEEEAHAGDHGERQGAEAAGAGGQ
ncbi:MAG: excinuclease ABC subunit UvrC [Oscillospiraceae bacterium]|nr:excinuclease ABC subunit UvrC [Oscillospiraceae bacterium]